MVSWKKVLSFAGAFIAFLIGSGFATGQELLQYFAAYGYMGLLSVVVMLVLFVYVGISFITVGFEQRFEKGNDIFRYYCGNALGTFLIIFLLYLSICLFLL